MLFGDKRSWFSTKRLEDPYASFSAWKGEVGVILDARLDPLRPTERFDATLESYLIGSVILCRCQAGGQKFDRPSVRLARDGLDHYMIQLFLRGRAEIFSSRRTLVARPGALLGLDLADTLDSWNDDFDLLCLFVPRAKLAPLLRDPDSIHGVIVDRETGIGTPLRAFLCHLFEAASTLGDEEAEAAASAMAHLLAAALNGAVGTSAEHAAVERAVLLTARRYIAEHLHEPELAPGAIAAALGLSRAQLYRMFEPLGGIMRYVRQQRLTRCLRELSAPGSAHLRIGEIAFRWGWGDLSSFNRAFKERYGITPREARNVGRLEIEEPADRMMPLVGDYKIQRWITELT